MTNKGSCVCVGGWTLMINLRLGLGPQCKIEEIGECIESVCEMFPTCWRVHGSLAWMDTCEDDGHGRRTDKVDKCIRVRFPRSEDHKDTKSPLYRATDQYFRLKGTLLSEAEIKEWLPKVLSEL